MITYLKMKLYLIPLIILGLLILRVILRGYFWRTKNKEKLSLKEFLKRWKRGIEGITPLQSTKTQLSGIWITITGIIAGIIVNCLVRIKNQWWWILIILIGSLILVGINFLTTWQKYLRLKEIDNQIKQLNKRRLLAGNGEQEEID